jgi:hypothetical protein
MDFRKPINNEDGSAIILALVMLMLLTLIGTSANNTATIEIQIAGNDRDYKQLFYLSEAAAMEALQRISDVTDTSQLQPAGGTALTYIVESSLDSYSDLRAAGQTSSLDPSTFFAVRSKGVATGSSLDMSNPTQLYEYEVHGMSEDRGYAHVEIGFRRRF